MSHYQVGKCAQCETQIMVRDSDGRFNSFKPNYKQIDVIFGCGHKMRVPVCSACAASPDYQVIIDAVTHDESNACDHDTKEALKKRGKPVCNAEVVG